MTFQDYMRCLLDVNSEIITENKMKMLVHQIVLCLTFSACSLSADTPPAPATLPISSPVGNATPTPVLVASPTLPATSAPTQTPAPTVPPSFCDDPRGRELIAALRTAIASSDGPSFGSLVSPSHGMDVRFYRDGKVINYDVEHAKFVFETTYQANWGLSYGSGEPTIGSFKDIVLPSLKQVFTTNARVLCDQMKTGGVTYEPIWPYPSKDFYSVHFPGTDQYGGLDWQTWAVGIENIKGHHYIASLVHYVWEP
jgi:hypothetical protein